MPRVIGGENFLTTSATIAAGGGGGYISYRDGQEYDLTWTGVGKASCKSLGISASTTNSGNAICDDITASGSGSEPYVSAGFLQHATGYGTPW